MAAIKTSAPTESKEIREARKSVEKAQTVLNVKVGAAATAHAAWLKSLLALDALLKGEPKDEPKSNGNGSDQGEEAE